MIKNIKITREISRGEYFTYRYMTITFLKIFKISIGQLGFRKVDIRFEMRWGWE